MQSAIMQALLMTEDGNQLRQYFIGRLWVCRATALLAVARLLRPRSVFRSISPSRHHEGHLKSTLKHFQFPILVRNRQQNATFPIIDRHLRDCCLAFSQRQFSPG